MSALRLPGSVIRGEVPRPRRSGKFRSTDPLSWSIQRPYFRAGMVFRCAHAPRDRGTKSLGCSD
jgi:hypothetical protein